MDNYDITAKILIDKWDVIKGGISGISKETIKQIIVPLLLAIFIAFGLENCLLHNSEKFGKAWEMIIYNITLRCDGLYSHSDEGINLTYYQRAFGDNTHFQKCGLKKHYIKNYINQYHIYLQKLV